MLAHLQGKHRYLLLDGANISVSGRAAILPLDILIIVFTVLLHCHVCVVHYWPGGLVIIRIVKLLREDRGVVGHWVSCDSVRGALIWGTGLGVAVGT